MNAENLSSKEQAMPDAVYVESVEYKRAQLVYAEVERLKRDNAQLQYALEQSEAKWLAQSARAAPPQEDFGHDFRSGVFTNCGYAGTASGFIVRDGTWWVATFRNETEANQYVAFRNAPAADTAADEDARWRKQAGLSGETLALRSEEQK